MKKLLSLVLTLMMLTLPALAETAAYPAAPGAAITVTGAATVTLKADYARVTVGVSTTDKTVEAASEQNNAAIFAVIEALKATGIAEEDIVTNSYSVHAEYDYSSFGGNKLSGYQVSNQLSVVIRDMEHIGATLDKATAAGANSIYNIEFLSTLADEAQDEATVHAVQDAMRKAKLLADAAGLTLGGITSIQESTNGLFFAARSYDSALTKAAGNSIMPNDASVSASVTIVFELK